MTTLRMVVARVRAMLTRRQLEHELDEELRSHLDLSTAEHVRRGLSPDAARARARRDLGCTAHVREQWRDARGFTPLDQRRYAGDPGVIGQAIVRSGEAFTIIGVMPGEFRFGEAQVWVPMGADETLAWEERGNSAGTYAIARMRAGVTFEQAAADMERVGEQVRADTGWPGMPTVTPLREVLVGNLRPSLLVLFGAVGFILLLACVNPANLLTARADARRREFALRASLGAGRGRLLRQLLTESVVMALGGGLLGVALARGLLPALVSELPLRVVLNAQIGLDARVLLFTLVVSVLTGLLFGLLPALGASRVSLVDALKDVGHGTGSAGGQGRIRSGLVIGEVALALVLLIGAGLMIRSFTRLQAVDPGFRTAGIATMWVSLPECGVHRHGGLDAVPRATPGARRCPSRGRRRGTEQRHRRSP